MRNRNKRVLWLLNHKTLMPYEVKLLLELGFEVFTPKIIPNSPAFRSGAIDTSYDSSLTIPNYVLARLNSFNFYEDVWPVDIVTYVNRYFGMVFTIPYSIQVREVVRKFEGQVLFRAFGLDSTQTYERVLETLFDTQIFSEISAIHNRFWFAQGYNELAKIEPPLIANRSIFLPIGAPEVFWKTKNTHTGTDKRILFVCPAIIDNPYYTAVYNTFKSEFGDLPHVIIGAQSNPSINDSHVLGFVSDEKLVELYRECVVLYYHSKEPRHVHYSPIEAAIKGTPVVYYADSLLGQMTPEVKLGRCTSTQEARSTIERILSGEKEFIDALCREQRSIADKFSHEYCKDLWICNLEEAGLKRVFEMDTFSSSIKRELRRFIVKPIAKGLLKKPLKNLSLSPEFDINDFSEISDGINFSKPKYPRFIKNINGLSDNEPWGRWSTGPVISLALTNCLPKKFKIVLTGGAYGPNIGMPIEIKIGNLKHSVIFNTPPWESETIILDYHCRRPSNCIQITVPKPVYLANSKRSIGLGLGNLKIVI